MASEKLELGVITSPGRSPDQAMAKVAELGLPTCQVSWPAENNLEQGEELRQAADRHGVRITTLWAVPPGRMVWNFVEGPTTIGIVPADMRNRRTEALINAAHVAAAIGVQSITTHVGFIPEFPGDEDYYGTLQALKAVVATCANEGIEFWFETGQETPVTLLRMIQDIGGDNVGINLDPANLLMYGKGNPIDAVDVFGEYVRGMHAKDGEYPTDGENLGREKPLGEGRVNFPVLLPKLKEKGFCGAVTIEREIAGPQQIADIKHAMKLLEPLL